MLEHTFQRAEKLIPPEQILIIVGKHHLQHVEVRRQLSGRDQDTVIVQPANKETGPGILLRGNTVFISRN
jgi:mannose-1-phosphate guanylyltransferase